MTKPNPQLRPALPDGTQDGDERTTLIEMLDYYRAVLERKASGLGHDDLHRALPPSSLTIGGLLHHLAMVEDTWFVYRFEGNPPPEPWVSADWEADHDWEFTSAVDRSPEQLLVQFHESVARSRSIVETATSLDQVAAVRNDDGTGINLRWILVHMIEEYARHCGHADFLRQAIDGVVDD